MIARIIEKDVSTNNTRFTSFSDKILLDFITHRNKKSLKELKGKIAFRDDYDYKSMRS